ncbi:MAG: threonine/serine exporter [Firmicutes bacterium]|nr:threonine/serine exporter [Bacillota bacterium]
MIIIMIASFIGSIAFAVLYRIPKRLLIISGLVGMLGMATSEMAALYVNQVTAIFIGATTTALISELFARWIREPSILFLIPGIFPLVPGGKAYMTMLSFLRNDYVTGIEELASTVFMAGAIAGGIIVVSSVFRFSRNRLAKIG